MRNSGFTLIELLLVIGIISLLMSVTFFRITEAKKSAEDSHMIQESAQMATAIELYKSDNNNKVPGNLTVTNGSGSKTILESDTSDYEAALQPLVNSGYYPSIPHSPSGKDYSYIISENGDEAVFAANLHFPQRGASRNSCPVVLLAPPDDSYDPLTCVEFPGHWTERAFRPKPGGGFYIEEPFYIYSQCFGKVYDADTQICVNFVNIGIGRDAALCNLINPTQKICSGSKQTDYCTCI